jgi:putative oxidoreductase
MNIIQRFEQWGDNHHPKWLDIIRIVLGLFLIWKGIDFLRNMSALISIMENKVAFGSFAFILIGHFVAFAHILGGGLIAAGIYTRLACLVQIPILLVAVLFINLGGNMLRPYSELFLSIIILLLLVYFAIIGNGPMAVRLEEKEEK